MTPVFTRAESYVIQPLLLINDDESGIHCLT